MTIRQLVHLLWAQRRALATFVAGATLLALVASLLTPRSYISDVSLIIDSKSTDPVTGSALPAQYSAGHLATQVDVISSRNVALKVVDQLRLAERPGFRDQYDASLPAPAVSGLIADSLRGGLDVRPSRDSNVVEVRFTAATAELSAEVANAFADAYIRTGLELAVDPARRQAGWFDEKLQDLRRGLEEKQQRLSEYQQKLGIVGTTDQLDVETARLSQLSERLAAAQAAMYDARTRQQQMASAIKANRLDEVPEIVASPVLRDMKSGLTKAEGKLSKLASRLDRRHPLYAAAAAEVSSLKTRIAAEIDDTRGSIVQSALVAEAQAGELQKAVDRQKARILELRQQRDGMSVLNREVENAQRSYDSAMQRASEVRLESQLDQSSIAVLNPATVPVRPSSPRILLNVTMGFIFSTILATGGLLIVELINPRIRNAQDLAGRLHIAVLATIPSSPQRHDRGALIARVLHPLQLGSPARTTESGSKPW